MMVCILIAFNWNSMVTLMSLEKKKTQTDSEGGRQFMFPEWLQMTRNTHEAGQDTLHTSLLCFCTKTCVSVLVYMLESACAAEISSLLIVIIRYYKDESHHMEAKPGKKPKPCENESLLVELECKVLVAAGEWSYRDRQRVHTYTVWNEWQIDREHVMLSEYWYILKKQRKKNWISSLYSEYNLTETSMKYFLKIMFWAF